VNARPVVAVYRHDLLPVSETFVREQAAKLDGFDALWIGLRRVPGLDLPEERVITVRTGPGTSPVATLRTQLGRVDPAFLERLRSRNPVLVHAHFEGGGVVAGPIARALGVPLVVTCHGSDVTVRDEIRWPNPLLRRYYRRRRRRLLRSGAAFIAVSRHIRRIMLDRGYPDDRTHVLHIGVDVDRLRPDPEVPREPVVLFVGRLVEKKGAEYLLRAMAAVERDVPSARLVVLGGGPLRASLESLARGLLQRVSFLGPRSHDEALDLMRRATLLSVPTVTASDGDSDGCAMVFQEAHALGLPVVAFASGGTPEAVLDGETGWLATERDVTALARGLTDLLTDPVRWRRFSAAARAHACRHFDIRRQNARIEALYTRALDSGPR
jgi:glycosyltransferase involved in cell wall biosynthesis